MKKRSLTAVLMAAACAVVCVAADSWGAPTPPRPRSVLVERLDEGIDVYGIVHWGLNTYTDREWGYGDETPALLAPEGFDADQIVGACKDGGLRGLVVVAKHHDGFCLWPTKTTAYNVSQSPFRAGKGDYVKEMADACRRAGLKFGVYCSPWDRNSAHYATETYVNIYHAQLKELLDGRYGEIFEVWFDGANGGDGYYGGAKEKRKIPSGYYRFDEIFSFVYRLQPRACIFGMGGDFRWPGNERGVLEPDSRATCRRRDLEGDADLQAKNLGAADGDCFCVCEADFPIRPGWFHHVSEKGKTKNAAYLMQRYLNTVGNGGTMNIGVAPDRRGRLDDEDVRALKGFGDFQKAFFSSPVTNGRANVVVLREDISRGERIAEWAISVGGRVLASGKVVGNKRIRILDAPVDVSKLKMTATGGAFKSVACFWADPDLVKLVQGATAESGETDTAKWMTRRLPNR